VKAVVEPSKVFGKIKAPQSKSYAIRYIFSAILTDIEIPNLIESSDIIDAINAVSIFGIRREGTRFRRPVELSLRSDMVFVKGSATVLRMLIPIVAVVGGRLHIDGDETLRRRPLKTIVKALSSKGISFSSNSLPLIMEGKLRDNYIELDGGESSQYITGFMYAFALSGGGTIVVKPSIPSKIYIYLTAQVLKEIGIDVHVYENRVDVEVYDKPRSISVEVPGDFLLASFYVAASLITGGEIEIYGLSKLGRDPGYHPIVDVYRGMGAYSVFKDGVWIASAARDYRGVVVDVEQDPDIAPSVAALASVVQGETILLNVSRLRIKESDRIETITNVLQSFGVKCWFDGSNMHIYGGTLRRSRIVCPDDHRVAMMGAAIATKVGGEIDRAECVDKSNPGFWSDLMKLNTRVSLVSL